MKPASKETDVENLALTPRNGGDYANNSSSATAAAAAASDKKRARTVHIGVAVFFLVNIIVLYILHFADRGNSSSSDAISGQFSTSTLASASSSSSESSSTSSPSEGHAVSFTTDGKLTKGAGTTAYLAAATLPADQKSIQFVHFTKLGVSKAVYNTNVMSYQQGSAPSIESVITTVSKTADKKELSIAAYDAKNVIKGSTIKGLTTLSDSSAIAVTTTTASDGLSYLVDVYPIAIADSTVSLGEKTFAVNNSATNFVSRVSASSFAIAYYEPYSSSAAYYQRVKVGSVADGKVSFSDSLVFGKANGETMTTFGRPQPVFNTSDRFTIPWFVDSFSATKDNRTVNGSVGLCLTTANYDAASKALTSLGDVCSTDLQPAYFIDSTQLSETVVVLIFFNRADNFALTVTTVEFSAISGIPTFRGSYVIEEASGAFDFGSASGFSPQPTLQVLSGNRLAVSFQNPSNSGKPSIKVLKFSSDLSMSDVSPVLPISNKDFSVASADPKAFGSIVLDMLPLETGFIVGYAGLWAGTQHQRVVLVESLGKPVGVVSKADGSDISVATSGAVEVSTKLTSGSTYYAATDGTLYAPSSTTNDEFVLVNDNNVVISKDALVGVAVSDKKLFVTA